MSEFLLRTVEYPMWALIAIAVVLLLVFAAMAWIVYKQARLIEELEDYIKPLRSSTIRRLMSITKNARPQ